jgi:hypothetical protein
MSGSTEKHFTATGPATIGFQTRPPDTNTHFDVGVEVSGLSLGVKGTGTGGERSPPVPGSGATGVQGNGSGIGSGVAGFGGNATPGTTGSNPTWCAGVLGAGGLGPQSGGPGVAGTGGANSGVGVLGQGGPPEPGNPGGPGVKGIGGANSSSDNADGVQGFASGTFSGVAGFGGGQSGTGVFGLAAVPLGQGFGASARAVRTRSRPVRLACMARAPRRAPGWSGRRGPLRPMACKALQVAPTRVWRVSEGTTPAPACLGSAVVLPARVSAASARGVQSPHPIPPPGFMGKAARRVPGLSGTAEMCRPE